MPINKKEITKAQMLKAIKCKTADELLELAKAEGVEITKEEAEAYLAELTDIELDNETLEKIAGGVGIRVHTTCQDNNSSGLSWGCINY